MKTKFILLPLLLILISGCSTMKTSNRCLTYTISGNSSIEWAPTDFYQNKNNKLYMQLPLNINFVPTIRVIDTEYDQPYNINYKFNKKTHQLEVEDNYDQYVLTRNSYDGLSPDKVYVSCNRKIAVKN